MGEEQNPFEYVKPTEQSVEDIKLIRERCDELHTLITQRIPNSREKSLAITKLEETSMWANKGIVFHQSPGDAVGIGVATCPPAE